MKYKLGVFMLLVVLVSGCITADTEPLKKDIDKVSKDVGALQKKVEGVEERVEKITAPYVAPAAKTPTVADISRKATDVPKPITRNTSEKVVVEIETKEVVATMADGVTYTYWTYGGTVPGPFLRIREGDTVELHLKNSKDNIMVHSIDLHAVSGQGGGAAGTQTKPGEEKIIEFKALNPGLYVYHCASPHIPTHVANGMYGLILVEPKGGLPAVNHEFYVVQGDFYTKGKTGEKGHQPFDIDKARAEKPEYVVFNGKWQAITGANSPKVKVGDTVRIYFGNGGPNMVSSFHVIGEIFDKVYPEGAIGSEPEKNVQTTLVPAGGSSIVEFKVDTAANYILVDHSIFRAIDKGAVGIIATEGEQVPAVLKHVK